MPRRAAEQPLTASNTVGKVPAGGALTKNDLLRFHAQLRRARQALAQRLPEGEGAAFAEYDALGITPLSLQVDRAGHYRAVLLLVEGIERALGATPVKERERL